jgi:hypothetical protein
MSRHDDFDRSLARWFEAEVQPASTADVLDRALRVTRRRRPRPRLFAALGSHWIGDSAGPTSGVATVGRTGGRTALALLLLLLVLALVAGAIQVGARLLQPAPSTVRLGAAQLVLHLESWHGERNEVERTEVAVYADGRVIWGPGKRGGFLEHRVTPVGLERLRSGALSTGLFERATLAIGTDVVGSGYIKVLRGDRQLIVAWGRNPGVDVSGLGPEDRFVRASSAQAVQVAELKAFLRDPTTWKLADDEYVQSEITPFAPSHLWVSYDRSRPNWSSLPSPAREVVTRILGPGFMDRCEHISLDQAREISQVLAQAGIIAPDHDVRFGLAFDVPGPPVSFVHAHPALPHDVGTVCGDM